MTRVYRTYEDGYVVRSMTEKDAELVQQWYGSMGHNSQYDLNIAMRVFPPSTPGFYIGEINGEVVASAIRIPWSCNVYYGSLYYVKPDYRRAGYGTRLRDEVAREHVGDNILCVDAVMGKVAKTNERFGYVEAFKTARFKGLASSQDGLDVNCCEEIIIKKGKDVPFDDLAEYDDQCFLAAGNPIRKAFLKEWISIPDGACFVATDDKGHVKGYGCRRPCMDEGHNIIGPLYAASPNIAEAILKYLTHGIPGQYFYIHTWEKNKEAMALAEKLGLDHVFDAMRMHLNGDPNEVKSSVYALTSIDVCGF